jgi:hypothetical protein
MIETFNFFFIIGLLVVASYAWQRFNEPSFPHQEALPRTVAPLRYLFLRRAYGRALLTYIAVSLLLYSVLVLPGPSIIATLSPGGAGEGFPAESWPLLVALLLVGVVPNSNFRWLIAIEESLRRLVHAWFFVPGGIVRTIGVLEDARYDPPSSQLDALPSSVRRRLRNDLKLPGNTLRYRWARATMLIASLRHMGAGAAHPLSRAAFAPFQDDFEAIVEKHRALQQDINALGDGSTHDDAEANLTDHVDKLLRRIYAYISWGVRHQADREHEVDQTLEDLGFRIPSTGGRRLFDIVMPAFLLVAAITMLFWLSVDAIDWMMGRATARTFRLSVVSALNSAMAASLMYGWVIYIALKRRAGQIEQRIWHQGSSRCLLPIAIHAGLVTWAVIIVSTVLGQLPTTLNSLYELMDRVATAWPWLLVGATASVLLASLMGGDVRRTGNPQRVRDAITVGGGLGLATAMAYLIHTSLGNVLTAPFGLVPIIGLAGFACGAAIGFVVPHACRANLVRPFDPIMARALRDLLDQAQSVLGTRAAAEEWVFLPRNELGGITPAEAVQYKTHATGVRTLLESAAPPQRRTTSSAERDTSPREELVFRVAPRPQGGTDVEPPDNGVKRKAGADPSGRPVHRHGSSGSTTSRSNLPYDRSALRTEGDALNRTV